MKLVHWLLFLALVTSSFDIFLTVDVGGANLRLSQVLLILVIVASGGQILQARTILWPRGGTALTLWCILQALLIARSASPLPSAELLLLLLLSIIGVFAVLQLYGRSTWVGTLMKAYLVSFVCIAVFGIFQFAAPALHLGQPLISQWIVHGKLPRVSGFSYEPSFYATYMIMGWITLVELRVQRASIIQGRTWYALTWLVSFALFVSTSKTIWALMLLEGLARLAPPGFRIVRRQFLRLRHGDLRIPVPRVRSLARIAVVVLLAAAALTAIGSSIDLNVFLQGSGLNNTAAHSVNKRKEDFDLTMKVIREEPWIGPGLGGVAARIGQFRGEPIKTAANLKFEWGFPVPLDVLAASGIIGVIPFLLFLYQISLGEAKLMRSHAHDERTRWLRALIRAFIFEWLTLSADQNLNRMYLWFHIAVLMAVGYNIRYTCQPQMSAEIAATA